MRFCSGLGGRRNSCFAMAFQLIVGDKPPTDMVIDEKYAELCSWADIQTSGNVMPKELTDIAVDLWENEETREQRKKQNKQ